jgi:serine protease Do
MTVPGDIIGLFGDSSALTPGFDIYCLGDPQGFEMTWTRGIVSAVSRRAPELGRWVQMDAAVSGGASGGLVLGVDGKIYGMVVAGSFYGNINFAVPSRTLLARIDGLLAGESYRPPWLGILFEDDFEETGKLVINEVFPSSWLKSTGLKTGDVILEVNGIPVASPPDAQAIVSSLPVGSIVKVKATSAKEGKNVEYYAQLSGRPEYALYSASQTYDKLAVLYTYFGFRISEKETDVSTVTISGRTYTVKVYEVREIKPKSILDRYGVKVGDAVGVLSDYTLGMRRYFDLIHLPKGKKIFENIADFIIELMEGAYDENIL